MTAAEISAEIAQARRNTLACAKCYRVPYVTYEPGCTRIECCGQIIAAPDWQPAQVVNAWNHQQAQP